jgi:hypothetical protein
MNNAELLNLPIQKLEFSTEFKEATMIMKLHTISEIVDILPEELFNRKGFSYTWLGELTEFLRRHNMLYLLQPAGGRSRP